jgi:hypothetical protein
MLNPGIESGFGSVQDFGSASGVFQPTDSCRIHGFISNPCPILTLIQSILDRLNAHLLAIFWSNRLPLVWLDRVNSGKLFPVLILILVGGWYQLCARASEIAKIKALLWINAKFLGQWSSQSTG